MKCPYDPTHENKEKPKQFGARYYAVCPICGRKARAIVYETIDNKLLYTLSRVGVKKGIEPKKVRSFRASDSEMEAVENGKLRLVVTNSRITVSA